MSKNLYLDLVTKDLSLTDTKNLRLTDTDSEFVSQKIENKFLFAFGEWFLNQEIGIPYLAEDNNDRDSNTKNILVKNPDLNFINSLYKTELKTMQTDGEIQDIISFNSVFDAANRRFVLNFSVKLNNGEIVTQDLTI